MVGVGHPGRTGADVEYELRDIRAFYKDANLYFGQQATFDVLQRKEADVLHLAAELSYGELSAGNSYLVLSDGVAYNTVKMIPWGMLGSLPPVSAVIVSDLGAHRPMKNSTLAQILLMNGTRDVIQQSYPPLRRSKKLFGEVFYTGLLSGGTFEGSFRQMQLQMIRTPEYSSPYIWAPFFLWGK